MALSGSISTDVGSHWQLKMSWTATQSISGNYSTVTAKLHWIALDSYGAISSSATKTCNITIAGNSANYSASGLAGLSANQDKVIWTRTIQVNHSSDGTGSFSLDGWFQAQVTLGGTYYDTINLTAKTFDLDTIPRASSLTSSANWTAGSDFTLSISRASSSFTHTAQIYVNGSLIKSITGIGTSASSSFSTSENTSIFTQLAQGSSQDTKITLITYDGSDNIGSKDYTGTVTAPKASTALIGNPTGVSETSGQESSTVYIDQSMTINITRYNSAFTHTLNFKDSNSGTVVHSATGIGTSLTYTFSSSEQSALYAKVPSDIEFDGQVDIITYYNGVQVQAIYGMDINYRVRNSNPTFGTGFTYADTNSTTTTLTGSNQNIVQNKSSVTVTIPATAKATAINGATMASYSLTLNGVTKTANYSTSDISVVFGTVSASTNQTLTVTAIDSRGNSTTSSKTVTILPYSTPVIKSSATRLNDFEAQTTLTLSGSISPLTVSGVQKNTVKTVQYQYKKTTDSAYNTASNFTFSTSGSTYTATNVSLTLDNTLAWNVQITVTDALGSTVTVQNVSTGQPLFFIDADKESVAVNQMPVNSNSFEVTGDITLNAPNRADDAPMASVFGSDATQKVYLNFGKASGSNDPAFIAHETSSATASVNRGVIHISPSDDNDNVNDYVTIHGTNDPETIKLYTGGNIWTNGNVTASTLNVSGTTTFSGAVNAPFLELNASTPYIDFKNNSADDYDMRIILNSDNVLDITGGSLQVDGAVNITGTNSLAFSTYGGGWFMQDTTWIRATGNKDVYTAGEMKADAGMISHGYNVLEAWSGGYKVQIGTANLGAMTAGSQDSVAVTFPHAFSSTPTVFLSLQNPEHITGYLNFQTAKTESTTGFTLYGIAYTALTYCYVTWIAIGS